MRKDIGHLLCTSVTKNQNRVFTQQFMRSASMQKGKNTFGTPRPIFESSLGCMPTG